MVIKLNIIGNFFGSDGYSNHTRQLANALNNLNDIEITLTVPLPQSWEQMVNDKELEMIKRNREDCDTILMIGQPIHWKPYLSEGKKFIGFLVWEGNKIPKSWINILNDKRVNQVWVPSTHTKNAILNTDGNVDVPYVDKIHIVPHGVDLTKFYPKPIEHKEFTFFANKGLRNIQDRGGLQYLIKAYLEEFNSKDNVKLSLKINSSYGIPDMDKIIKELKIENKDLPKIDMSVDNYKYEDMYKLYNRADVFVSPTRAEAFNIPCIEAMACGLPVITTNYGGQIDFVKDLDNGWLIDYKLEEVKHEIEYEGVSWAVPNIDTLRNILRRVYEEKDNLKSYKENALKTAKEYTWKNSAKIAHECLLE